MATIEYVVDFARSYVRDHPQFFQSTVSKSDTSTTFELPHKRVGARDLVVVFTPTGGSAETLTTPEQYLLDERNGLVRIVDVGLSIGELYVEGYHYDWFTEGDLFMFARKVVREHKRGNRDWQLDNAPEVEADIIAMGTVAEAVWALLLEVSRDIDVSTPEGIALPLTQRFRQLFELWNQVTAQYEHDAAAINVGLNRIEMFNLRRRSMTTNRLVPVYREREWDDAAPIQRVFPPIDTAGAPTTPPDSFVPSTTVGFYDVYEAAESGDPT